MIDIVGRLTAAFRVLLLPVLVFAAAGACADESYSFSVVPQFEQRKLFAIWKPIVDELTARTGVRFNLIATLTVPEFEHGLSKGAFDFVYANPYHILRERKRQGYGPLVRDNVPLTGVVVVAMNSPATKVTDLAGKTLAVPSPNALGASLMVRAELEELYHLHMSVMDVKTHSSVYLNVATGLADAGGGVQKTLSEQDERIRNALRVLYTTRGMPSHPVATHPRVPAAVREAVRKALLEMAASPAGKALLAKVPMNQPVSASMSDYLAMESWGLEKYWIEEEK